MNLTYHLMIFTDLDMRFPKLIVLKIKNFIQSVSRKQSNIVWSRKQACKQEAQYVIPGAMGP